LLKVIKIYDKINKKKEKKMIMFSMISEKTPKENMKTIREMFNNMYTYGLINEEIADTIDYLIGRWAITQPEYQKIYKEYAKEEGQEINDLDELYDFATDYEGETFPIELIEEEKISDKTAKYAILMYLCLARKVIYNFYSNSFDEEEAIEECKKEVDEWIKDNEEYMK
jgi:hypothetical protein